MSNGFQQVASVAELREGQAQSFILDDGEEVLLVRIRDEVFAIQPTCTHQETWLDLGRVLPQSFEIECPLHDGRFDLRTGEPTNPPVIVPIKTYAVHVKEGAVFVSKGHTP